MVEQNIYKTLEQKDRQASHQGKFNDSKIQYDAPDDTKNTTHDGDDHQLGVTRISNGDAAAVALCLAVPEQVPNDVPLKLVATFWAMLPNAECLLFCRHLETFLRNAALRLAKSASRAE